MAIIVRPYGEDTTGLPVADVVLATPIREARITKDPLTQQNSRYHPVKGVLGHEVGNIGGGGAGTRRPVDEGQNPPVCREKRP